jgi:hypothetical protein
LLGPMTLNSGLKNIAQNEEQQLENFRQVHQNKIEKIEEALQELEVDRDKINSIY